MKRIVAWVLLAVDVLGAVAITVMVILGTAPSATVPAAAALVFMALSFAVVGGLLAQRRPRNAEGWLLLAVGTAWLVPMVSVGLGQSLLEQYADGPVAAWLAWPGVWLWLPPLGLMGTQVLLRFPDGALPSQRWRWFSRLTLVLVATATIAMAISAPTNDGGYANLTYLPWVPQSLLLAAGLAALACFPSAWHQWSSATAAPGPSSASRSAGWPGPPAPSSAFTCSGSSRSSRGRSPTARR